MSTVVVEIAMVVGMLAPFVAALVRLPAYLIELRAMRAHDVVDGAGELICLERRRSRKVTKAELLRVSSEATIESARRVLIATRRMAKKNEISRRVENLQLADIRRQVKQATRRSRVSKKDLHKIKECV